MPSGLPPFTFSPPGPRPSDRPADAGRWHDFARPTHALRVTTTQPDAAGRAPFYLSSLRSLLAQSRKLLLGPFYLLTRLHLSTPKAGCLHEKFVPGHVLFIKEPRLPLAVCLH